ncbi:type II secretion system protein [Bradyrhizobium sp. Tv2a-2]|uniref:type IV pilus modification PilV family protein n=1 Tax=Bradyrhizobium sp. Tv2a-2 TaxID=113395 RepID=UPI000464CFF4|nr:type II secretion system protein [Bradyrhizobium sp. Tv2a-2]
MKYQRSDAGFALVEAIVAFMVLAIGLASIGASLALAMRSDARLEARRVALQFARSRLETAGITEPLTPGQHVGHGAGNLRWSQTVTEVRTGAEPRRTAAPAPPRRGPQAYWVEVAVETKDGSVTRLAALKIAPVGSP